MYKSQTLDSIRQNIDRIDNTVHDLLMERAELASSIAAEKKKRGMPVVHPAREARMIRRLLARHNGPLPKQAITRIWRELVSAVSMLQSGLKAVYYIENNTPENVKIITDYFGSLLPLKQVASFDAAIADLMSGHSDFVIVDALYTQNEMTAPWFAPYVELVAQNQNGSNRPSIVQALPFVGFADDFNKNGFHVITRAHFETSDDDMSYLVYKTSDAKALNDICAKAMASLNVEQYKVYEVQQDGQYFGLCIIDQYIDPEQPSFIELAHKDKNEFGGTWLHLGGHPKALKV